MLITRANTAAVNAISKQELQLDALRIIRYRTALALVEDLRKSGELSPDTYERAKGLIALRYDVKSNSIYR